MAEKVSTKITRLERELSDEIGRSIELYSSIRTQAELIDQFISYLVLEGIAEDSKHAVRIVRDYPKRKSDNRQLSFNFE